MESKKWKEISPESRIHNNRINSDWQFRCAPLPAGYAERYAFGGHEVEYSLQFSQRLIAAARSFLDKDKVDDETGRAVLYLSLLSCEISLKALLEQAGFSMKELKKRSHDFFWLD